MAYFDGKYEDIEEYINSGRYRVVGLDILEHPENIQVTNETKDHMDYSFELYLNYINRIKELSLDHQLRFLRTLKAAEIMDNQKMEQENSFLISLYMSMMGNNSIDEMIEFGKKEITPDDVIEVHKLLLEGTTSSKKEIKGYRQENRSFVGSVRNGVRNIQYFPIRYDEIEEAMNRFLSYYNKSEANDTDIFIKPFIIHGLLAALQCFNDGNTRLSRLFQHIKMWQLTNEKLNMELPEPAIYISRSYYPYRQEYREKIKNIVVNTDTISWNDWFNFNLNRLEDQLFYIDNNLEEFKKIL